MIRVLFCCHGNSCRSPMSQYVLQNMVNQAGMSDLFYIDSKATHTDEIGNQPHRGTIQKMHETGIPVFPHTATQVKKGDYTEFDYIIGMDEENINNLKVVFSGDLDKKIYKLLNFAGSDRDIADPWYTGNFDKTYEDIIEGCEAFMKYVKEKEENK